ncbi:hypothetical protein HCC61_23770 [Streptomyces sp. HNM0575]|uniref:hypothetical protein n=1 Tax=Streptomyces sp. HNM0575 TaxID=2716338 RepID=UPI00145D40FF|nr:hypothetical protein [Streptomyces sp. HNM0575]NLU75639.1 hypothetical protein [Streptomyces sp. HNM0575]
MRKLREAAAVVAMVGSVSMVGAGVAAACGEHEESTPPSVSIECTQDTGSNTATTQTGTVNISDALNGGDANSSANQQLCGLSNEDPENTAGDATGGAGGAIGTIDVGL